MALELLVEVTRSARTRGEDEAAYSSIGFQPVSGRSGLFPRNRVSRMIPVVYKTTRSGQKNRLEAYSTVRSGVSSDVRGFVAILGQVH